MATCNNVALNGTQKMKIILTATSNSLDSLLDERFGRAPYFLVYDLDQNHAEFIKNDNLDAAQGAGIQSAQNIVKTGAKCLITGQCGPKALRVLESAKIKVLNTTAKPLKECIEHFSQDNLDAIDSVL